MPVRSEWLAAVDDLGGRLGGGLRRLVERRKTELRSAARALPTPEALLAQPRQRLDMAGQRLPSAIGGGLDRRRVALARLGQRLEARSPRTELARRRGQVESLGLKLDAYFNRACAEGPHHAERDRDRLEALSQRLSLAFVSANRRRADRLAGLASCWTA